MMDTKENNISNDIFTILDEAKSIATTFPNKSYTMCENAYHMSKKSNLKLEEGFALIGMSLACRAKSEVNRMLDYSYNALEIFEASKSPLGEIQALNLIGIAYFYNSMYDKALECLFAAINLLNDSKDYYMLSSVLNNIGEVFRELGEYDSALEYYYSSLKISTEANLRINIASIFINIGEIYFIENKYDQALGYFTKSYDILMEEKEMILLGEVENKLGKIHYINKNYTKAKEYFYNALNRLENIANKFYAIDVLVNLARLDFDKDSNNSFYYFEKAIEYAEKTNANKKLSEVYKLVAEYYEKVESFRNALEYYKKYSRINQEIMTSIAGNKLEIFQIELKYLTENLKIKNINHRLEMEITNQRNELEKIQKSNKILEKKALEDELTGIANRRFINYHLKKTFEEALLADERITLFIIDIDNFKKYNDYWGHLTGDDCLIKVAHCLKNIQVLRKDTLGRYGGEEFIYYTTGIDYDQALELGNIVRYEVEKLCLKHTLDNNSNVITISVGGVCGKASNFVDILNIIQIADEELYKAKKMGRNITLLNDFIRKAL